MIRRVIVRPPALEDIASAATWYDEQGAGLGEELIDELVAAMRRAQEAPALFPIIRLRDGLRRVLSKRFPYRVVFSVVEETVYVHAVLHCAQHERRWKER